MDGWMDRWMDGWMDGWMDLKTTRARLAVQLPLARAMSTLASYLLSPRMTSGAMYTGVPTPVFVLEFISCFE